MSGYGTLLAMDDPLHTIAYVDGYNLYYQGLRKSRYKWLDLRTLLQKILIDSDPSNHGQLTGVKFFTAPIKAKYASDPNSQDRQNRYHNALKFAPSGPTEVILGHHTLETKTVHPLADDGEEGAPIRARVVEEKQTDVNIALHMYRDVSRGDVDQVVLLSNDSDLVPGLKMIREDFPDIPIGVIFPVVTAKGEKASASKQNQALVELSDWRRWHINVAELEAAQLPRSILNRKKKAIVRPDEW